MQSPSLALLFTYLGLAHSALLPSLPSGLTLPTNLSLTTALPSALPHEQHAIFQRIDYLVPTTSTLISVCLHNTHPLPPMEVEIVLSAIEQQLTTHISLHGDGPLLDGDDPYEFGIPGCFCSTSASSENSLTYGVLRDTMTGLQQVMVSEGRFFVAYFDIYEKSAAGKRLGEGNLDEHETASLARFV